MPSPTRRRRHPNRPHHPPLHRLGRHSLRTAARCEAATNLKLVDSGFKLLTMSFMEVVVYVLMLNEYPNFDL